MIKNLNDIFVMVKTIDPEFFHDLEDFKDYMTETGEYCKKKLSKFDIEVMEQEGGGEGGSEYCYSIIRVGNQYFKWEYSYYSYNGYEWDDNDLIEVEPHEVTVTQYFTKKVK